MDYELIFWVVAGALGLLGFLAIITIGRTTSDDQYHGIGFQEKNIDDMEDRA